MEEMCVNYVHYYPRTQLELCKSHVDPGYLQKYFSLINRYSSGSLAVSLCISGPLILALTWGQLIIHLTTSKDAI